MRTDPFINIERDTPLLLPPNLGERVPAGHLARFIVDAGGGLDLRRC